MLPAAPPPGGGNFIPPSNPLVSTFYEVSQQRGHAELVLAVWSCAHKLLSCNAVRNHKLRHRLMATQSFTSVFERNPTSLPRLSWPDLCGPTRTLHDKELAGRIDESCAPIGSVAPPLTFARHEKLKLIHLSLRDGLTNACTVRSSGGMLTPRHSSPRRQELCCYPRASVRSICY